MGEIQGYFVTLLSFAVLCALIEMLCPEGEGGGIGRHMRLLIALCLLCVLLQPLMRLLQGGANLPERLRDALDGWLAEQEMSEEAYRDRWKRESESLDLTLAGRSLEELLAQRFGFAKDEVTVTLQTDESGERLSNLHVALRGRAIWVNIHEMQAFIRETFGCDCNIYLE